MEIKENEYGNTWSFHDYV